MLCIGNFEENMDLSHIYLAVNTLRIKSGCPKYAHQNNLDIKVEVFLEGHKN